MDEKNYSNKFLDNHLNRKKIAALVNYSETLDNFTDWLALEFLASWLRQEPLDREGTRFLDHLLKKWRINYLDWACRTQWVKSQISCKRAEQLEFVFDELEQDRIRSWRDMPMPSFVRRHSTVQL